MEVADREVVNREVVDREVEEVSHIWCLDNIKCFFAPLPCSVSCLKLFLLFQFQFMVRNLREVSVCT